MSEIRNKRKTESKEIEKSILFAIFKYGNVTFEIIRGLILPEDFAWEIHRRIYKTIETEYDKNGSVISYPGFYKFVLGLPETTDEDKVKYKVVLEDIKECKIKEEDVVSYSQQLKEHSNSRKLIKTLTRTSETLDDSSVPDTISFLEEQLDTLKKQINVGSNVSCTKLKQDIEKRVEYLKKVKTNPEEAGIVWTGFKNFDNFNPPLKRGSFGMFQARTNMGKSMFLMGMALQNYYGVYSKSFHKEDVKDKVKGNKVIIITIEMSDSEYAFRMDSHITGFKHTEEFALANIVEDDHKISVWKKRIQEYGANDTDIMIYWVPENCTPNVVDQIITNNPFKPDLVIVDYIGDMSAGLSGLSNYDWKAQAYLYTRMKQLAGKHQCVIFSAQQTIRGVKKISDETGSASDKASHIADLLIAIEQTDADKLHNDRDSEGNDVEGRLSLRIYKVRSGKRLVTHIIPEFYKMNWTEKEMSEAIEAGESKTTENKQKKSKSVLENTTVERPHIDKKDKETIDYEIKIEDSKLVNLAEINVPPKEVDDAKLLDALKLLDKS